MDISTLKDILNRHYSLTGDLELIYSEVDEVFSLTKSGTEKYVIKISNPDRPEEILSLESDALDHLSNLSFPYSVQEILPTADGNKTVSYNDVHIRVLKWIEATVLADCIPQTSSTRNSIGNLLGIVSKGLKNFKSKAAHRFIKWDPSQFLWIEDQIQYVPADWQVIFKAQFNTFRTKTLPVLKECPMQINYNDANDYNILCTWNETRQAFEANALIDWLDIVYTHRINELAIGCAYCLLKIQDPLSAATEVVGAYHAVNPLLDQELQVLYDMILARLMISVTVSAINKAEHPENEYLQITDRNAWHLLEQWISVHPSFAYYTFRAICGETPTPKEKRFNQWIIGKSFAPIVSPSLLIKPFLLDLQVGSNELGNFSTFLNDVLFAKHIEQIKSEQGCSITVGAYNEIRPIYTTEGFRKEGNLGPEWRTVHLGLDLFAPNGTAVYVSHPGEIYSAQDNSGPRDYGPTIIIRHHDPDLVWYSLFGHLSKSSLDLFKPGDPVAKGQTIGMIGNSGENGGWPAHVHFQIILDILNQTGDFPGVANYKEHKVWLSICPDPFLITGIKTQADSKTSLDELITSRHSHLGPNLSISYKKPLWIQRGMRQYLLDHTGRRYLDTVNNVAHCGHEHPRIVAKGAAAMGVLNTNTRYLHENILRLSSRLIERFDPSLSICYFTNSGTEANELAIRMAKNYTGSSDIVTIQWGYHGNSSGMVDLSSYKFDRKGGKGKPVHTHLIPMPDPFRGKYAEKPDQSKWYLKELQDILDTLSEKKSKPAALFAESILSCGGQVVYPDSFMTEAVKMIKKAGGIYIADEVQTGLGRIGSCFSAYELYGVVPDIVTLGKPLGNGHPVGAVICTRDIANAFNNGMEYFNTFGGNPVSCAIALEVLQIIEDENLMQQAKLAGDYLLKELTQLKNEFNIIADLRGYGLFLGIELMLPDQPATKAANYLTGRMRDFGILMSTDGPDDNVIKIKPPMCFDMNNADEVLTRFRSILNEYPFQI